ncbi:MAG: hypothetical protein R3250_16070, partial [Melioribacteraceae bacterium]|nr:hypothetical protein [Melioribacteraceae bacterium]
MFSASKENKVKLSNLLLRRTIQISLIVGIVYGLGEVVVDYQDIESRQSASLYRLVNTTKSTATNIAYNLDRSGAESLIVGIMELPFITNAQLLNEFDEPLALSNQSRDIQSTYTRKFTDSFFNKESTINVPLYSPDDDTLQIGSFILSVD